MHTLGTVVPDRHRVVDEDGVHGRREAGGGLEAGEEPWRGGHDVGDRDARVLEVGSDDRVILFDISISLRVANRTGGSDEGGGCGLTIG